MKYTAQKACTTQYLMSAQNKPSKVRLVVPEFTRLQALCFHSMIWNEDLAKTTTRTAVPKEGAVAFLIVPLPHLTRIQVLSKLAIGGLQRERGKKNMGDCPQPCLLLG